MKTRLLRKLYGMSVVYTVSGIGIQFSFATMTVTFGAGLAYLGAAAFLADIVMEKFLPESEVYVAMKSKEVRKHGLSLQIVEDKDKNTHYQKLSN